MARFNRRSTAEQVSEGVNLSGKNALVTGANTGLGQETARVLASRGANVTMACRNEVKAQEAKQFILESSKGSISEEQLDILELDLNSMAAVRTAAEAFNAKQRPLHRLINNAGIMIPMERRTDDGFEAHLGINHLGHFLFTNLLLDSLLRAEGARVVMVSSSAMGMATLTPDFVDLNWEARKFSGFRSYGDSKLMNLMFSNELNRRYSGRGIVSNALHPGVIATELARDQSVPFMLLGLFMLPFMKTVPRGAATSVYLATSPDYELRGGLFFSDCQQKKVPHKLAQDEEACSELWRRSCQMTGLADSYP